MRSASVLIAALPLLAFAPLGEQPTFHVQKGAKLVKSFEQQLDLELEDMRLRFGEEEISHDQMGDFELSIASHSKVVFTDEYVELGDGRPSKLRRSFDELGGRETETTTSEEGPEETVRDQESKLEGKTVVFTWSEEQQAFVPKFEGDEGDPELLEALVEDGDLRAFLPGKDVAEDDSWEVDAKAFDCLVNPGGDLALESEDGDEEPDDTDEQLRDNLTGTIKATYKGTREVEGVKLAVIALEAKVRTSSEQTSDEDGASSRSKYAAEFELEGEILWNLAAGHARSAALAGPAKVTIEEHSDHDFEGEHFTVEQVIVLGGNLKIDAEYGD